MADIYEFKIKLDKKQKPLQKDKLVFKKYRVIKPIGKGSYSIVYQAKNILKNNYVAIKAEKRTVPSMEDLESETFILYTIRGFGIPEILSFGKTKTHNILVMTLLGKSLLDTFIFRKKYDSINDISSVAIQILDRIEWVHSKNYVYRDIKPENFLFGEKDKDILYLIDFGLCKKYKSSKTGKHILPKNIGRFIGTARYASINAMSGKEQSRRDDIISIGYMIIYLMKRDLPWIIIKGNNYVERHKKEYNMKKNIKLEDLCKDLPIEILDYMKYANSLKFEQEPDYKILKNFFKNILNKNGISFDKYVLSWCEKEKLTINKKSSQRQTERKSTPQKSLYRKIQTSLENKSKSIPFPNLKNIKLSEENIITRNLFNIKTSNIMVNKNINNINSNGLYDYPGIYSERNNYSYINNNNISSLKNEISINKVSLENNDNYYRNLNLQSSDRAYSDKKKMEIFKIGNNFKKNRKIKNISPISNNNKINQITIENVSSNNAINKEDCPCNKKINENKIYNPCNKYNSNNKISDKILKKNNNVHQKVSKGIHNYQNYKIINNNNFKNINNDIVYSHKSLYSDNLIEKNTKIDNNILNNDINKIVNNNINMNKKYNPKTFSIINKENKKYIGINLINRNNNKTNKFYNTNYSNQILGNNNNSNSNNIHHSPICINIYNNKIQNIEKRFNYKKKI